MPTRGVSALNSALPALTPVPSPPIITLQEHSGELAAVLDLVMAHQGLQHRVELVSRLMLTLVLPSPAMYRPQLRRLAQLAVKGTEELGQRARHLLVRRVA